MAEDYSGGRRHALWRQGLAALYSEAPHSGGRRRGGMTERDSTKPAGSYTVSLANRKARGAGHERLGEILAAAKTLFLEQGFENVSTRRIAERVGISQTALFTYYKTKDEIFGRLISSAFEELARAMDEVDRLAEDPRDWLRRCIAGYVAFGLKHPDEYRLAFMAVKSYRKPYNADQAEPVGEGRGVGLPIFQQLERHVADAMAQGIVRRDLGTPLAVTQAFWASMHGLVAILIARGPAHFPWEGLDTLIAVQTEMLLGGLQLKS